MIEESHYSMCCIQDYYYYFSRSLHKMILWWQFCIFIELCISCCRIPTHTIPLIICKTLLCSFLVCTSVASAFCTKIRRHNLLINNMLLKTHRTNSCISYWWSYFFANLLLLIKCWKSIFSDIDTFGKSQLNNFIGYQLSCSNNMCIGSITVFINNII